MLLDPDMVDEFHIYMKNEHNDDGERSVRESVLIVVEDGDNYERPWACKLSEDGEQVIHDERVKNFLIAAEAAIGIHHAQE